MSIPDDTTNPPLKRCTKCGVEYPATLEYFGKNQKGKYGLRSHCKACRNADVRRYQAAHLDEASERMRRYRAENPERYRELARQQYAKDPEKYRARLHQYRTENPERYRENERRRYAEDPERGRERRRRYYKAHSELERERGRQYYKANADKEHKRHHRYHKEHPEKSREASRRYRTKKANLPFTFTTEHERIALDYFNGCCAACGRQLKDLFGTHTVHWDHWIPLSKGGGYTPDNILPLCGGQRGCNQSKGTKDAADWLRTCYNKRKTLAILERIDAYFVWIKSREEEDKKNHD